jgi:uncharacterized phage protein gp47/JayE
MADYPIPNIDEGTRRGLELTRALLPELDTSTGGLAYRETRVLAALVADNHAHLEAVDRDAVPTTAEDEALERWGSFVDITKKGATTATGPGALQVSGTPGSIVVAGLILRDRTTGVEVETTSEVTIPGTGTALVSVESITTGTRANLPASSVLDFLAPPAGLSPAAALVATLTGGEDAENDGALRERVVARFREPPQGGNAADFTQWVLLVAGISFGYALPLRNGLGTVDLVGLRSGQGAARLPSSAQRAAIAAVVSALEPLGASGRSRVLEPVAETVDVVVDITPLQTPDAAFDWDDADLLTVAAYDAGTRTVTTSVALPSDFDAGDRVVFAGDGRVFLVGAIVAANQFTLTTDNPDQLAYTPPVSTEIYAGGPLTEPARAAILDGYPGPDGVLVPGINQLGPANEEGRYGAWRDTVEETSVAAAAQAVAGVYRAQVTSLAVGGVPVAGGIARPSDPAVPGAIPAETVTIGVLVAGAVVVRKVRP